MKTLSAQRMKSKLKSVGWFGCALAAYDNIAKWLSTFISTNSLKIRMKLLGCNYGRGLRADGPVIIRVSRYGSISIGHHVCFKSRFRSNWSGLVGPVVLTTIGNGKISIGHYSGFSGVVLSSRSSIEIGNHVNIGANTRVFDHDFHSTNADERRRTSVAPPETVKSSPVIIEDDVFIGTSAIILKGVHLGPRSIVGAGAVVARCQSPADARLYGNPARIR